MTLGATPFSIYQTYTPDQIAYVVEDAGARIAIIEQAVPAACSRRARACPSSST